MLGDDNEPKEDAMAMKLTRWLMDEGGRNRMEPSRWLTEFGSALRKGVGWMIALALLFWISLAVPALAGGPDN